MADKSIGPGTVLAGRFRLEDLLQESAGAKFWRATDLILARNVAVHVVSAHDQRADALLVAARTSATVTDGHFLRVLDAAEESGVVYAVNEWGSGMSLDRMLADGPLPPRRAAWLVKEVAEAVTTAHAHGVAHGRLLPENVMVTEAGSVKLIGFVVDAVLSGRGALHAPDGTPISEHESDVLNLGALLYATLVGKWPGTPGSSLPEAPREHGHPLRPRQVRAGVPRSLDAICDRVLNPGGSHGTPVETAHEICAALSDYIGESTGLAQLGYEPTSVLERDDFGGLTQPWAVAGGDRPSPAPGSAQQSEPTASDEADSPGEATSVDEERSPFAQGESPEPQAGAGGGTETGRPEAPAEPTDPDATQAGAPVFYDDESGVGWVSGADGRGLGSDEVGRTPAPPPPPPPEPEPKPLYAPGPPRHYPSRTDVAAGSSWDSSPAQQTGPRSSSGTGSLPPVWGPDAAVPPSPDERRSGPEDAGKRWLRLAAVIAGVVLLVVAVVIAFNLGRDSGDAGPPAGQEQSPGPQQEQPSGPLDIAGATDFDPQADPPEENPELVGQAIDGNPSTAWRTMTYFRTPELGNLKEGVGLVVDLGEPNEVSRAELDLVGQPYSLELLAAGEGAGQPTSVEGLQQVASADGAGPQVTLELDQPTTTRYLVVWLTSLPPADGGFRGEIAEITVHP